MMNFAKFAHLSILFAIGILLAMVLAMPLMPVITTTYITLMVLLATLIIFTGTMLYLEASQL